MPVLTIHPATPQERTHSFTAPRCDIGRSPTNNLTLEEDSISGYHARIERRGDDFWLIDLNSTNGTFVNNAPIKEARLKDGDVLQLGEVIKVRFNLAPEETAKTVPPTTTILYIPETGPENPPPSPTPPSPVTPVSPEAPVTPVGPGSALAQRGVQCPSCQALIPFSVNFCPRCGYSLAQQAPLAFPMQPQPVGFVRPMEHPGAPSAGMLPLLALLCGVFGFIFGVPAVLAIILGLLALGHIRRHGGLESDRKQAIWGVFLGFFWVVVCVAGLSWYIWSRAETTRHAQMVEQQDITEKQIAENEAAAISDLKGIACAQKYAKIARLKDPNRTGKGQYLTLPDLGELRPPFFRRDLADNKADQYRFTIRDASEAEYLAIAEPVRYNVTGRRTFSVDPSGVIRGQDLKGRSFDQATAQLPAVTETKSAYDGMDNAIANEVIARAKRLAEEKQYDLCRQILDDVPLQFAMTTAAQELNSLKKSVDPFIIEAQASAKHQKAAAAANANDLKLAISLLKEITDLYPTYTKITAVTDELVKHQTSLLQQLDKQARQLFEKAEVFEREGKPEDALKLYVEIEKNYPDTDWAKRIVEQKPLLQKSIREKAAEQLHVQARTLAIATDFRNIVNLLEQLQRNYADTDYVQRNRDPVTTLFLKAQAEQYRALAMEQMTAGRDTDALARLEEACANNPDARLSFRDLFLKLYPRVARKRMDDGDPREALRLFTGYLMLEPSTNEVSTTVLSKLQFDVAKIEFNQGRYIEALQLLIGAKPEHGNDPEFNDLYGSVEVARGNYAESIEYFSRAIAVKTNAANYYARRGYAQILFALQIEQEAMIAYAGLLRAPTNATPETATATATNVPMEVMALLLPPTNTPPAGTTPTDVFAPVFATTLPPTATGLKPEVQIRYDDASSQALLDQALDLLDSLSATNVALRVRPTTRSTPAGTNTNANATASASSGTTSSSSSRDRLQRLRTTAGFGKALSSLRQRILDCNKRREISSTALLRMSQLLTTGNRDLVKAIQLKADHAPGLIDILKATDQHEKLITKAAPKISAYLAIEVDVIEKVTQMAESMYRSLRIQHTSVMDPTPTLDLYFSRWCDRASFDQGAQFLREAGAIKVPLENYSILPVAAVAPVPAVKSPVQPAKPAATAPTPESSE